VTTNRLISTHEAQVRTMQVEVRVMKVGNKQVTLALYRQLTREQVIDARTGQLRGVPWGLVNYNAGDCGGYGPEHLHVVWQKGGALRRCCVTPEMKQDGGGQRALDDAARDRSRAVSLAFLLTGLGQRATAPDGSPCACFYPASSYSYCIYRLGGLRFTNHDPAYDSLHVFWNNAAEDLAGPRPPPDHGAHGCPFGPEQQRRDNAGRAEKFRKARAAVLEHAADCRRQLAQGGWRLPGEPTPQDCLALAGEIDGHAERLRTRWRERYAELAALEQLFIAL
jgi:hypothetical protein